MQWAVRMTKQIGLVSCCAGYGICLTLTPICGLFFAETKFVDCGAVTGTAVLCVEAELQTNRHRQIYMDIGYMDIWIWIYGYMEFRGDDY